ncbi:hypothetical protein [Leptolyngbya sp. CCY15150]|uniref:hypothetical protein n=1 Tax=Leptolyngbya sp. CCY15150 TaxID=2767772 RepID=UPI001951D8BD|nr:hypothetical protein [Leptolyngbya sp. CCY15150]
MRSPLLAWEKAWGKGRRGSSVNQPRTQDPKTMGEQPTSYPPIDAIASMTRTWF